MCRGVFEFQIRPKETCNLISALHVLPELQKVVDLPPNLKFMLSTFLILTQYEITGKQLNGVL